MNWKSTMIAANKKYNTTYQCFITAFNQCILLCHPKALKCLKYAVIISNDAFVVDMINMNRDCF